MDEEFAWLLSDPKNNANKFFKIHKHEFIDKRCDLSVFRRSSSPITILTAGCTGAGKTEFSRALLDRMADAYAKLGREFQQFVIADVDDIYLELRAKYHFNEDLRSQLNWTCNKFTERLVDFSQKHDQNLLIDSTFSKQKSIDNISRALGRNRTVVVYFIMEEIETAWNYVKVRECKEGRSVTPKFFAQSYIGSRQVVQQAIDLFGNRITVKLYQKGKDSMDQGPFNSRYVCLDENVKNLDKYVKQEYNSENEIVSMITI